MFSKFVRHTVLGAAVLCAASGAAMAQSLTDALVDTYKNSELIEQSRALLRSADEDVAIAVSRLRPILNYSADYGYSDNFGRETDNGSLGITASLLLFDFGRTRLGIEANKELVLATREALRATEQDVLLEGVSAFLNVRGANDNVDLRRNNVRVITEQLRAARDRFEVGEVTRTDVAQAEARLAEANANLTRALGQQAAAREVYRAVVGQFPQSLAPPPPSPAIPATVEEATSIAERTHPSILQGRHNVRASEIVAEVAQKAILPTASATANISRSIRDSLDDTTDSSIGLTLSGPIYQGGGLSAQYRQALAGVENARATLNQSVLVIRQRVGIAWAEILVTRANIDSTRRQVEAAEIAFEGVTEEARLGARTTLDVLDAEQDVLDARTALLSAEISAVQAVYDLLSAMGLMTVDYLGLPVPTYDPAAYFNAVSNAPATSTQGARLDRVLQSIMRD
ncbi:putative outer membrane protein tolC [Dinoroseobacter shibae DFL 12 = DSM 16493]|uniref:Putative outer membrane protein tolC n=2 Tax=Roseobacteraceae TaxID=2854170 RepID=A8LPY1_DINSH|nr:putative outer membrane protein tolC [Dinoroseobacter shibae DFL 12 = DSM 16493]